MVRKIKLFIIKNWIYITIFSFLAVIILILLLLMKEEGIMVDPDSPPGVEDVDSDMFNPSDFLAVQQPLSYYKNYTINFEPTILAEIDADTKEYSGFQIADINRSPLIEGFIESNRLGNLEYAYESDGLGDESGFYSWSNSESSILYDTFRHNVFMKFEEPILLRGMQFRPVNRISIHDAVGKFLNEYFNLNTNYDVKGVVADGDYYKIEFARLLNGYPIYREVGYDYILISTEGELKQASFIIADFHRYLGFDYELISGTELSRRIGDLKYPKNINFQILDSEIKRMYEPYGYGMSVDLVHQKGTIEIDSKEIVYLYSDTSHAVIVPTFMFTGDGYIDIGGRDVPAEFLVLSSAIDFEYVYIHPQSFFDLLE